MTASEAQRELEVRAAAVFRALGHHTRVAAVGRLRDGERQVGELARDLGVESSTMSQQLAVLRTAGLVRTRRVGAATVYGLSTPDVAVLLGLANSIVACALGRAERLLASLAAAEAVG